jgi:excisionase family DNA binding protein
VQLLVQRQPEGSDRTGLARNVLGSHRLEGLAYPASTRYPVAMPAPRYDTLDQAAARLGVHKRTVNRWITEGKLTAYHKPGDQHTFLRASEVGKLAKHLPRHVYNRPGTGVSSTSANTG